VLLLLLLVHHRTAIVEIIFIENVGLILNWITDIRFHYYMNDASSF